MDSEREFRISGRDWERLSSQDLERILDDTGADTPAGDHTSAEVYCLAREVALSRKLLQECYNVLTAQQRAHEQVGNVIGNRGAVQEFVCQHHEPCWKANDAMLTALVDIVEKI